MDKLQVRKKRILSTMIIASGQIMNLEAAKFDAMLRLCFDMFDTFEPMITPMHVSSSLVLIATLSILTAFRA